MRDLLVLSPCFYPNLTRVHMLVDSARYHNIPLHLYGVGEPFKDWIDTHVVRLSQELQKSKAKHFLFVDAVDCFFLGSLEEIWEKYESYGSPFLLAACENNGLNAGGFIGEREWMILALDYLLKYREGGDPQERWRSFDAPLKAELMLLDDKRSIFQCMNEEDVIQMTDSRSINRRTNEQPCILHFCGGYCDPVHGRLERMQPWWDKCYGNHKG